MYYFRPAQERGTANFGWLQSKHSFSFGYYYDRMHMGFSALRVINDDTVRPGAGFDTHGHRDMEIISYILEGAIEHVDSEGNRFVVPAGEVQRMSAGTGITHSEYNHSTSQRLKFLQIWIQPNRQGIKPGYEQKSIIQTKKLTPLVTPDGRDDSLTMQQDASLYRLHLKSGESVVLDTRIRPGYLHVIEGSATFNSNHKMMAGDGLGLFKEDIQLQAGIDGITALWFDLPHQ
ncbi:quercetin 2,3-dioxygenase [Microbulbifer sp. NBRC 101763]|uniref:pirin family protein n=1 Tax=Microbulbifer sp. NBRC 101763 TaxID=1113820 RepID=UPI0030B0F391